jgi:hypothetical protein
VLPKGAYVPVFEQRQVVAPERRKWMVSAMIVVAALLALVGAAILETQHGAVRHGSGARQYLSP